MAGKIILLILVVVVTLGSFAEVSSQPTYRHTRWRVALALIVPLLWCLTIALPDWDYWIPRLPWLVLPLLFLGGPAWFVFSIVGWIGWILTRNTKGK